MKFVSVTTGEISVQIRSYQYLTPISISRHQVYPIECLLMRSRLCLTWIYTISIVVLHHHHSSLYWTAVTSRQPDQFVLYLEILLWMTGSSMTD